MNNTRGSTLVELIMVMLLLVLFGATGYTLVHAGALTQQRIMQEKDAQTEARIVLSYINVKLRQNDESGKVAVEKATLTGKDALVIKDRAEDYAFDTWIFCYEGKLLECLIPPGEQPTELASFYIADAEELVVSVDPDSGAITNTLYYYSGGQLKNVSETIYMRSH